MLAHSIVVMTFNQCDTIEKAIQSVVCQTELPLELVVLDDCSSDGTADIAEEVLGKQAVIKNWRVIRNEMNLGIARNTKKISEVIQGNVITHLSGDDFLSPKTVEAVRCKLTELKINPDEDLFLGIGPIKKFDASGENIVTYKLLSNNLLRSAIIKTFPFVKVGCSARLLRAAKYPTDVGLWGDWVWDVNICSQKKVLYYFFESPLYHYRLGCGVGTKTDQRSIECSYLMAAKRIYEVHKNDINLSDKSYLLGEIYHYKSVISGRIFYSIIAFLFFAINTLILHDLTLFKSTLTRYIPATIFKKWR